MNKTYALIILVTLVVVAGVFIFRVENEPSNTQTNDNEISKQCIQQSALEICAELDKKEITETESFNVLVNIRNISGEEFKTTFSTTCTDPLLFINNEPMTIDQVCGQALTDVVLQTEEIKTYNVGPVLASELKSGENVLRVAWQEYSGPKLRIFLN